RRRATLSGRRQAGATAAVRTFAAEAVQLGPRAAIANRLVEDRSLPGFGHMLYPDDDPRAAALLERFKPPPELQALREAVHAVAGIAPNVDFALMGGRAGPRLATHRPLGL